MDTYKQYYLTINGVNTIVLVDELEPEHLKILLEKLIKEFNNLPEQVQLRFKDYINNK